MHTRASLSLSCLLLACGPRAEQPSASSAETPPLAPTPEPDPPPACDRAALIDLSHQLTTDAPAPSVWPALKSACTDALPKAARAHFDNTPPTPEDTLTFARLACPEWPTAARELANVPPDMQGTFAYEACNIARFEGFADDELRGPVPYPMLWSMHQLLLDQGLTPTQALPLTRALLELEQSRLEHAVE